MIEDKLLGREEVRLAGRVEDEGFMAAGASLMV